MALMENRQNIRACRNSGGNTSSIEPISLENRFRIRPAGVESKNFTGAFIVARVIFL